MNNFNITNVIVNTLAGLFSTVINQREYNYNVLIGASSGLVSSLIFNGNLSSTIIGGSINGGVGIIASAAAENLNYFGITLVLSLSATGLINYQTPIPITSLTSVVPIVLSTIYNNPENINQMAAFFFDADYLFNDEYFY